MKGQNVADVKVKFSTNYRDRNEVYEQGKTYPLPFAFASSVIANGLAVEAPRNARNNTPEPAGKNTEPAETKGGK